LTALIVDGVEAIVVVEDVPVVVVVLIVVLVVEGVLCWPNSRLATLASLSTEDHEITDLLYVEEVEAVVVLVVVVVVEGVLGW
jgi:hypothetical protein